MSLCWCGHLVNLFTPEGVPHWWVLDRVKSINASGTYGSERVKPILQYATLRCIGQPTGHQTMHLNTANSHSKRQCKTNTCCYRKQRTQTPKGLNADKMLQRTQLRQAVDSVELHLTWVFVIVIVFSKIIGYVISDIHQFSQSSVLELWKICCYLLATGLLCIKKVK